MHLVKLVDVVVQLRLQDECTTSLVSQVRRTWHPCRDPYRRLMLVQLLDIDDTWYRRRLMLTRQHTLSGHPDDGVNVSIQLAHPVHWAIQLCIVLAHLLHHMNTFPGDGWH